MDLQTAIEILEYYQEWRLGKREDMIHEPKKLTEALDTVISEFKKFRLDAAVGRSEQLKCEKCGAKFMPHLMKPLTICDKCADSFAL